MKARDYKFFRAGEVYHVYNRGDNRDDIFLNDSDYVAFLVRFKIALGLLDPQAAQLRIRPVPQDGFSVLAYCLMPNHFHVLIKQNTAQDIGEVINKVCTSYVRYFNFRYKRIGNLFQDTFKAKHVDNDSYLTYLSAYIHNNPSDPLHYTYSSFPEYLGTRSGTLCNPDIILRYFNNDRGAYSNFVQGYTYKEHERIQHLTFDET